MMGCLIGLYNLRLNKSKKIFMLPINMRNIFYFRIEHGGKKFAVIGACWGAWANFQISSEIELVCGVNWHPSVHMEEFVH